MLRCSTYDELVADPKSGLQPPKGDQSFWERVMYIQDPKKDFNIDFDNVEFEAKDKSIIRAWLIRPSKNNNDICIIGSHGAYVG